ncbi:MAG: hypothetical protein DU429_05215 [Candidatus Tokpelaia sp.]|nr:MAG: hypothetical protein DU430_07835 [Candidatus Tokpelaia sp.]KAA6206862.1 MAG: hypothetical protein DU429_05215 [Candidatus Tokpelaia sp.]KAA6404622.1 hypothetical protein DPQ22_09075 [Candidatus Tokpelaia sp.]
MTGNYVIAAAGDNIFLLRQGKTRKEPPEYKKLRAGGIRQKPRTSGTQSILICLAILFYL